MGCFSHRVELSVFPTLLIDRCLAEADRVLHARSSRKKSVPRARGMHVELQYYYNTTVILQLYY